MKERKKYGVFMPFQYQIKEIVYSVLIKLGWIIGNFLDTYIFPNITQDDFCDPDFILSYIFMIITYYIFNWSFAVIIMCGVFIFPFTRPFGILKIITKGPGIGDVK